MRDWRTCAPGHYLRWKGGLWVIERNLNGILHLEALENPEARRKLSLADWQHLCSEGAIEMVEDPHADVPHEDRDLEGVAFSALPESMQRAVTRMRWYVEAFLDPHAFYDRMMPNLPREQRHVPDKLSERKVDPLLRHVQEAHEPDGKKPGFSTFRTWYREYESKGNWVACAPRYDKRGSDEATAIIGRLKRIVDKAIADAWMKPGGTKLAVWELIEAKISTHNRRYPDKQIGVSQRHVYRYIDDNVDKYAAAVAQRGREWADRQFKPVMAGPRAEYALHIVDVDHTTAKLEVTHDETGANLGRPTITVALDRYSRMVVGIHIHFEGETLNAALQCLKNVLTPKRFLRTGVPAITYDYPCCGRPVKFHFDRGTGFDNEHIDEVGVGLDINLETSPGGHPQFKGGIERFLGNLHKKVALGVKGATPRVNGAEGIARPRKSQATMAFSDFWERVWYWVAMVYAKEFHEGLQDTPLNVWNESTSIKPLRPPPPKKDIELYLLRSVRAQLTREGVEVSGLIWNERSVVRRILAYPGPRPQVLVRIDDNDLGRAFITDPITKLIEPLEPVLANYMPGTTWHQHELVKRKVEKSKKGTQSERTLIEAKAKLVRDAVATFEMKTTKSKTRTRIAKMHGIGSVAPAGDSLGSLDPRIPLPHLDIKEDEPRPARGRARRSAKEDAVPPEQVPVPATQPEEPAKRSRVSGPARRV